MLPGSRERGAEAGAPWGDPLQLAEVPADRGPALAHPRARPLPALPSGPAHFPATCPRVALSSPSTSCHSRSPHPNTPAQEPGPDGLWSRWCRGWRRGQGEGSER